MNHRTLTGAIALVMLLASRGAPAEEIVVSNYKVTTNGMPFAIATEKGYFKEFKANVTGILSSDGGTTTIRNLLGGKLAYGEAAVSAIVSAVQGEARISRSSATTSIRSPSSSGWRCPTRRSIR